VGLPAFLANHLARRLEEADQLAFAMRLAAEDAGITGTFARSGAETRMSSAAVGAVFDVLMTRKARAMHGGDASSSRSSHSSRRGDPKQRYPAARAQPSAETETTRQKGCLADNTLAGAADMAVRATSAPTDLGSACAPSCQSHLVSAALTTIRATTTAAGRAPSYTGSSIWTGISMGVAIGIA
jgi:hypothetical protein